MVRVVAGLGGKGVVVEGGCDLFRIMVGIEVGVLVGVVSCVGFEGRRLV